SCPAPGDLPSRRHDARLTEVCKARTQEVLHSGHGTTGQGEGGEAGEGGDHGSGRQEDDLVPRGRSGGAPSEGVQGTALRVGDRAGSSAAVARDRGLGSAAWTHGNRTPTVGLALSTAGGVRW